MNWVTGAKLPLRLGRAGITSQVSKLLQQLLRRLRHN
jgi:hypothetical protein